MVFEGVRWPPQLGDRGRLSPDNLDQPESLSGDQSDSRSSSTMPPLFFASTLE